MGLLADFKTLYHLAVKRVRGDSHAARMDSFYAGQAQSYDDFRRRLLKGRATLLSQLDIPDGAVWCDLGGGTASNLEHVADRIDRLKQVYVVDVAPSLLAVARDRIQRHGWTNVETVEADATGFTPPEESVDVVTFSYSLTMIPDWFAAIENARGMLREGGRIGVVDFYVSRKHPGEGQRKHRWFTRSFWPVWFAADNVFPSSDHLPFLQRHFDVEYVEESRGKIPYLPLLRMPYYVLVGVKPAEPPRVAPR